MSATVAIRYATPADAGAIAEVHVDGWRWGYRGLLPKDTIEAQTVDDREHMWTGIFTGPHRDGEGCLAAEDADGTVVGFVSFGPAGGDFEPPPEGAGEVYALYLREEVRDTGVGRALLARASDALRSSGFPTAVLWVLETNALARRFYEKGGWEADGARSVHRFDCGERPIVRYAVTLAGA